ncbi:hypothetical protein [Vreelandella piezotolerans]|uniref:hypothetical protein n=1 Tax=Vreelandella piezotolerans TaxID=2609667 RepID=UPI001C625193|nr:hypothetical protein [Halomonas piezotolerans]
MLSNLKVVHLSESPLVGAPGKISNALCRIGVNSISYVKKDYPLKSGGLGGFFMDNSILINSSIKSNEFDSFVFNLSQADVIHIHNWIDLSLFESVLKYCYKAKFVYHVHSPLREGPLFDEKSGNFPVDFSARLVVSQYQPRHYQGYTVVPNIVLENPALSLREKSKPLKVLYSPSHKRDGRWNNKGSSEVTDILKSLKASGHIEMYSIDQPINPKALFQIRRMCDVTIDEIVTGAFHQVSLEGLCAGNVVINNADFFTQQIFQHSVGAEMPPPFVKSDEKTILDNLIALSKDVDYCNAVKRKGFEYFSENLIPENLANRYLKIYEEL